MWAKPPHDRPKLVLIADAWPVALVCRGHLLFPSWLLHPDLEAAAASVSPQKSWLGGCFKGFWKRAGRLEAKCIFIIWGLISLFFKPFQGPELVFRLRQQQGGEEKGGKLHVDGQLCA